MFSMANKGATGVPSLEKAIRVLRLLARRRREWGLSEIARELKISKSTLHGILSTLEKEGVLVRNPLTKRYGLGPTLFELARQGLEHLPLREVAREAMERLRAVAHETVFLGVLNGEKVTIVDVLESDEDLKVTSPIGTRVPMMAGALGKVFLARMDEAEVRAILKRKGLPRFTPKSITRIEEYTKELQRVREEGVALDDEEYLEGIRAVAAPIETPLPPPAAIWIVGFSATLTREKMKRLVPYVRRAAKEIAEALRSVP